MPPPRPNPPTHFEQKGVFCFVCLLTTAACEKKGKFAEETLVFVLVFFFFCFHQHISLSRYYANETASL